MSICFARFVALDVLSLRHHSGGFDNAISLSKASHSSNPVQQHQVAESVAPSTTNAGYLTPMSGTSTPGRQLPSTQGYVQQNRSLGPKTVSFSPQKPTVCIIPPSLPSKRRIDFEEFRSTRYIMKRPKHHHEINGGAEFVKPRPLPSSRNPVAPYDQAATLQTPTAPLGEAGVGMSAFQVALNKSPSSAFKKTPSSSPPYDQAATLQTPTAPLGEAGVGMSAFQVALNKSPSSAFKKTPSSSPPYDQAATLQTPTAPLGEAGVGMSAFQVALNKSPSSAFKKTTSSSPPYDQAATLQTPTAPLREAGVGMSAFQVALNKSPSSAFKKTPSPQDHHVNHVYQQTNDTQAQLEDNEVASINQDHGQQLPPPQNHQVEHEAQRGDLFHGQEVKGDPLVGNGRSPAFSLTSPAYSLTSSIPSPGLTEQVLHEWLGLTSFE